MTLQATQKLLESERVWTIAARVAKLDGQASHYEVNGEGHVIVSVRSLRHDVPLWAMLRGGGNNGTGLWEIPSVGTEVIVNFDDGFFEGDAYIVAVVGKAPAGLTDAKVLLIGPNVEIRSVNGTAKKLAYEDDLNALETKFNNHVTLYNSHVHPCVLPLIGAPPATAEGPTAVTVSVDTPISTSTGTSVVKGE